MLEINEERLVDVAQRIARSLPVGEFHTVAAAAMDINGDIHTGVNRQVLLDLHPDVYVIVSIDGVLKAEPIRDLLPTSYRAAGSAGRRRVVYFRSRYFDSIVAGRKTATVRYRDPLEVGPAVFVFDDGRTVRRLEGHVEQIDARKVATLSDDDAQREDYEDRGSLLDALADHYPNLGDDDMIDVVTFRLLKPR